MLIILLIIFCTAVASLDTGQDKGLYCGRQQTNRMVLMLHLFGIVGDIVSLKDNTGGLKHGFLCA